jgi:hypothetical protein
MIPSPPTSLGQAFNNFLPTQMFTTTKAMCRTKSAVLPAQCQGHFGRSNVSTVKILIKLGLNAYLRNHADW